MKYNLPEKFQNSMKMLLGTEVYPAFLASYERPVRAGLRLNRLKTDPESYLKDTKFTLESIPWIDNGFYYEEDDRVSHHPHYYAGLYYLQEPSAMTPASLLPIEKGDLVLDLCAAPGGKATELAAKLQGTGFLLANDISNSRAKALLKNLERFGVFNMAVCSEDPEKLVQEFPETFDKILLDAPCSGEGMFHKEPQMTAAWEEHPPKYYSEIQRKLILQAADMLKPGGMLVYSTCTFSMLENEGTIDWLLKNRSSFSLSSVQRYEGFSKGMNPYPEAVRIYPHKMGGEGHFVAVLRKYGIPEEIEAPVKTGLGFEELPKEALEFLSLVRESHIFSTDGSFMLKNDCLYYLPVQPVTSHKLRYLRTGLLLGEYKKNRFEPSQALAMALERTEYPLTLNLSSEDSRTVRYLKGETIEAPELSMEKGYVLICTDGFPLGWGKTAQGRIKNKYNPGWRML